MGTRLAGLVLLGFVATGCIPGGSGPAAPGGGTAPVATSPGCRIDSIDLPAVTRTGENLIRCGATEYAAACNEAVTALDTNCATQCALYVKRSASRPTDPDVDQGTCGPDPVRTTTAAFDSGLHCAEVVDGDSRTFSVTCIVSAKCSCDP